MRNSKKISKRFDGKRFYETTSFSKIPVSPNDVYITANDSTKLDVLAYEYYNDSSLWWVIARANNIGFGYSVDAGKQLRIPANF